MKSLCILLFLATASPLFAQQDSVYAYYDAYWKKLPDTTEARFFRVVKSLPEGKFLVRDYYISGKLQFVGHCIALEPKLDIEGEATLYHESGGVQQVGHFKAEKPVGLHKYYYEHGGPHKTIFHREGEKDLYHHFWSREGKPQLVNGNGLACEYFPGRPTQCYEIQDSLAIASFTDGDGGSPVYVMVEQQPEYRGGLTAMVRDLRANLKYPKVARQFGIQGTVYVSFVVGPKGEVADVRLLKGIYHECDEAAIAAVNKLTKWSPGMHKGKPVFVRFVLPVNFHLN